MPDPTLLGDSIQPAWNSLTAAQRTCWHIFAATHPVLDNTGRLRTLYGQQYHYRTNAWIAVAESPALIASPPTTTTPPTAADIQTAVWPLSALRQGGGTARAGTAYLAMKYPNADTVVIIVRQGYTTKKSGNVKPPRIRHVTVIQPEAAGPWDLVVPEGYFASTGGRRKFSVITGRNAKRRPDKPLGNALMIDINNGQKLSVMLRNPYGGARKKTNRPRATAVNPTPGDHYP